MHLSKLPPGKKSFFMNYYSDKVVLVTGASSGLGLALVEKLLVVPRCRVIASSRSTTKLYNILGNHENLQTFRLDLESTDDQIEADISCAFELFGTIDIAVNCAGMGFRGKVDETKSEVDRRIMQVDYFGQIAVIKALISEWLTRGFTGKHIIQVSSVQGYFGLGERAPYSASKHALVGFIDSLRAEVDDLSPTSPVKVSLVSPAYIATNHSTNAVTGDGSTYNLKDESTVMGFPPQQVASMTLLKASRGDREIVIADSKIRMLMMIRSLFPLLAFQLLRVKYLGEKESFLKTVFKWLFS